MSEEFNHVGHLALFSEIYTGGAIYTSTPQIPSQASVAGPKQRRRRKKAKKDSGMNGAFGKKRKLSEEQVKMLERSFGSEHKLESERKDRLAAELGLEPKQVAVWFQNRRARWKSKKLEDEYCKLRSEHDAVVLHKCRLETQLLKLKEELNEAQKEIQRLSTDKTMRCNNNSPTPSSSLTMDTTNNVVEPAPLFHMHVGADFNFDTCNFNLQEDYYIPAFDVWSSTLYLM